MNDIHIVICYREDKIVRSEYCMSIWEADYLSKELIASEMYDNVKVVSKGEYDAKLV